MNLEAIGTYLTELGLVKKGGRSGEVYTLPSLFLRMRPAMDTTTVLLLEPLSGTAINHYAKNYVTGTFQLVVSAGRYSEGKALADTLLNALTIERNQITDDMFVQQCLPNHHPVSFPKTEGDEIEHSVMFTIHYINT